MPRPPVKPEDRQRVAWACNPCKASKKRCDGRQPCSPCGQKGIVDSCRYVAGRRNHGARAPAASSPSSTQQDPEQARLQQPQHPQRQRNHLHPSSSSITTTTNKPQRPSIQSAVSPPITWDSSRHASPEPSEHESHPRASSTQEAPNGGGGSGSTTDQTRDSSHDNFGQPSVMLSSLSGEKVFIGDTAAISFLRFLQRTLKRHAGPSGFTDDQDSHRLFEVPSAEPGSDRFVDDLGLDAKKTLVQCFLDASSGLLDLYSGGEIARLLGTSQDAGQHGSPPRIMGGPALASLYLMIAIGAQCRGHGPADVACAAKYFTQARRLSFEKMLQDPTLDLIRAFLLMAFYMLGACRRNSAFMYLGVASRAADILGLQVSAQQRRFPAEVRDARLRTAMSLRVLDVVCSSILGRRSSTLPLRAGTNAADPSGSGDPGAAANYRGLALHATYELSEVLDAAVAKSGEEGLDTTSAEVFLRTLRQRSRTLPAALRQQPARRDGSRDMTIGNVHVSGAYYFGVILVTRRFLIQHIMPQLGGAPSRPPPDPETSTIVAELSRACVEAATYMAQMCSQVMEAGALLGNMCIIKAWIFATGLVLGFSLLVEDDASTTEGREAFRSSLEVLGALRRLSPQAEQYYGILVNFADAISAYKDQLRRERRTARGSLVERIFSPNFLHQAEGGGDAPAGAATELPTPDPTVLDDTPSTWFGGDGGGGDAVMPFDDPLSEQWWLPGESDVMMRLLWDGYAMDWPHPLSADALGEPDAFHVSTSHQNPGM